MNYDDNGGQASMIFLLLKNNRHSLSNFIFWE